MELGDFAPALRAATVMNGFARPWGVAGGWAVDLAAGRRTRGHANVDVAVMRDALGELRRFLRGWKLFYLLGERPTLWDGAQLLLPNVTHLRAVGPRGEYFEVRPCGCTVDGIDWQCARVGAVRRNLSKLFRRGGFNVPIVAPEIVLWHKSEAPAARDELDLSVALPALDEEARGWLREQLGASGRVWRERV